MSQRSIQTLISISIMLLENVPSIKIVYMLKNIENNSIIKNLYPKMLSMLEKLDIFGVPIKLKTLK